MSSKPVRAPIPLLVSLAAASAGQAQGLAERGQRRHHITPRLARDTQGGLVTTPAIQGDDYVIRANWQF